jgi:hypothetical protein
MMRANIRYQMERNGYGVGFEVGMCALGDEQVPFAQNR